MADTKISALPTGQFQSTDYIPYVDGASGITRKATKADLRGSQGSQGSASTVAGPQGSQGSQGSASTVPGPRGSQGSAGMDGADAVAGKLPSSFVSTTTPVGTTSVTLEDVTNMSTTITLDESVEIGVFASFEIETQSGSSASVIGLAISIDGVDGDVFERYLSGSNDKGIGAITYRSAELAAGTYTVKLRFQRVSGTTTPGINNAAMLVMAMQGAKGETGPMGPIGNQGSMGSVGSQGSQGSASTVPGPTGATGATGPTGYVVPRVTSQATASAPTPDADTTDVFSLTAQGETAAFVTPSGTPSNKQKLIIQILPTGGNINVTWSTGYTAGGVALPTSATQAKKTTLGFMYDTDNSFNTWVLLAKAEQA